MMATNAITPSPQSHDPVRLYAGMLQSLEALIESDKLGDLFATVRHAGDGVSLVIADDPDIQRMLKRIGVLPSRCDASAAVKLIEDFVRTTAVAVSRQASHIGVVLRLYASGMYGFLPNPVCGSTPRCRECRITKLCDYYNAPPRTPSTKPLTPEQRLSKEGHDSLSDEEVLQLLIGGSRAGRTVLEQARALLQRFGSLRGIASASYGELRGLRDLPASTAARLAGAAAYHHRILAERRMLGPTIRCGKDFYDLYWPALRDRKKESFLVVLLDQKNRVIRDERVSEGSLTASVVHPREVFAPAIRESAAAIAFVHNHPSGDSTPSPEDIELTRRLCESGRLVGIRVLDHVIIGEGAYTSFIDEGLM